MSLQPIGRDDVNAFRPLIAVAEAKARRPRKPATAPPEGNGQPPRLLACFHRSGLLDADARPVAGAVRREFREWAAGRVREEDEGPRPTAGPEFTPSPLDVAWWAGFTLGEAGEWGRAPEGMTDREGYWFVCGRLSGFQASPEGSPGRMTCGPDATGSPPRRSRFTTPNWSRPVASRWPGTGPDGRPTGASRDASPPRSASHARRFGPASLPPPVRRRPRPILPLPSLRATPIR